MSKSFKSAQVHALDDLTFDVGKGEFISVVGPSGCGKTTLLRLINGLIKPDNGEVLVNGRPPDPKQNMAMVFQSARLLPWRTVAGNIEFVLRLRGHSRADCRDRALALLGAVGLRDFADAHPHELSGGMRQRVGLARALAVEPDVLLMDEPFAALDAMTRETLRIELLRLWERRHMAVVFVTHDIDEAIILSQRIVVLRPRPGRIDAVVPVDLPEPRSQVDPRGLPAFADLRRSLWDRIHAMGREGTVLEELTGAFSEHAPNRGEPR
ncbi:ABC transporter ATP-binding protein [Maritimibacter dapengensis]|uniref:ABC transporter ATP-binding protein n=1 Tax=Maritimibacter dapengensis TaxID=2836868 RepID=UPI00300C90E2